MNTNKLNCLRILWTVICRYSFEQLIINVESLIQLQPIIVGSRSLIMPYLREKKQQNETSIKQSPLECPLEEVLKTETNYFLCDKAIDFKKERIKRNGYVKYKTTKNSCLFTPSVIQSISFLTREYRELGMLP